MSKIKSRTQNPSGLHARYIISKVSGEPVDRDAEYFVLRLDKHGSDLNHIRACRIGLMAYADAIEPFIPKLANDLRRRYNPKKLPVKAGPFGDVGEGYGCLS